jgi:SAM-dependent methyltransferase
MVYRLLWRLARNTGRISNGFLYLAAGLLRDDELQADSEARWRAFGASVDDIDAGLTEGEQEFYTGCARTTDRILLVGSGAGRDLVALHSLGFRVSGLEQVPALVELSRRRIANRGLEIPIQSGTVQTTALAGSFDLVIFSLGCYSYVRGAAVRIATLERLGRHLNPAGRLLLSYHPCTGGTSIARALTHVAARTSFAGWLPERGDVFSRDYKVPDVLRYHHEFEVRDVASECSRAGFQIVEDEMRGPLRFAVAVRIGEARTRPASARMASHTAGSAASDRR